MEAKNWEVLMNWIETIQLLGYNVNITNNTYIAIKKDSEDSPCVICNDKRGLYFSIKTAKDEFDKLS